jgi:F0F1-type ATP synthase membrane subunit c/vacuolar-type H+-ATPase subunit K
MLNFFIGFAFFEAGAFFGFFVAALLNAAHAGQEESHEEI